MRQPIAPIAARNGSPPIQAATATPPNSGPGRARSRQPDALDQRARLARFLGRRAVGIVDRLDELRRLAARWLAVHRWASSAERHQVAGDRRRALAAAAALLDEHGDRDPSASRPARSR